MSDPRPNCEEMFDGRVRAWTKGVPFDEGAREQVKNVASLPFVQSVAIMPDVHWGMGATIGSVIPTQGAIIPAAVGVDIGCGMVACKTNIDPNSLTRLSELRSQIEEAVPHGRTDNGGKNDSGAWGDLPNEVADSWNLHLSCRYDEITTKHPGAISKNNVRQLGTLGTGNHFIEICLDEDDAVWVMLHSGSRGLGNRLGTYFINLAKKEMERFFINLPDKNLAYLVEGTEYFDDYVEAVQFGQDFAAMNRKIMLSRVLDVLAKRFHRFIALEEEAINCHHNYVTKEHHFNQNLWITRKGALNAGKGTLGIIPGSMGARSYIVEGLGSTLSYDSCSHGAGRVMSRREANKTITLEQHAEATKGVECRKDEGVIDESPAAYKDIDAVMAAQSDLVKVKHTLKQIICVKG